MNLTPQTPPHPSGDNRFKLLDVAIKRHQFRQDSLIEILHSAQELFGYLDSDVLVYVGRSLRVPLSRVYGVATFYNFFSMKPTGEHTCVVCMGTACYVKGAGQILEALEKKHGIKARRDDRGRQGLAGHGPLPGRLRVSARGRVRRRGRGQDRGRGDARAHTPWSDGTTVPETGAAMSTEARRDLQEREGARRGSAAAWPHAGPPAACRTAARKCARRSTRQSRRRGPRTWR